MNSTQRKPPRLYATTTKHSRKISEGYISIVKDRTVSVLAEFVPIEFSPDAPGESNKIERDSGFKENSILDMRWIKPPQKHSPGQRTAHLIVRFKSTETANLAIQDGVMVLHKRVWACRMKKEPRRCLKCQTFNSRHFADECISPEICGTCRRLHCTAECTENDRSKYKCATCKTTGHASWDRLCPKFVELCNQMDGNNPKSTYKFFPSNNAWTWESVNATKCLRDAFGDTSVCTKT